MNSDRLARIIAASVARHQSRGLVDDAAGLADVVIHGRVDLLAVAEDVAAASIAQREPERRSWAAWFACGADARRQHRRDEREREKLERQLDCGSNTAAAAIVRLRIRASDL